MWCAVLKRKKSLQYKKWGVQSLSCVQLFATLWTAAHQAPLSFTISQSLLKFNSIESMMSSNHLVICWPFGSCLQSCPKSGSSLMSQPLASGGQSIGASGSASVLSTNIRVGTRISFRVDWFDLLSVQETPKSLLQHHSSKASILRHSAFFMVQLSHPYVTTGKATALTLQALVRKVMSLFFNMLSKLLIAFLKRGKCL